MSVIDALVAVHVALSFVPGYQASPERDRVAMFTNITPDYFRVTGTPLLAGRAFTPADVSGAPRTVIVNETFARAFFPGQNPVRRSFAVQRFDGHPDMQAEIVGIVIDAKARSPRDRIEPVIYAAVAQSQPAGSSVRVSIKLTNE